MYIDFFLRRRSSRTLIVMFSRWQMGVLARYLGVETCSPPHYNPLQSVAWLSKYVFFRGGQCVI